MIYLIIVTVALSVEGVPNCPARNTILLLVTDVDEKLMD